MPDNDSELLGYADDEYKERYGFSDKTEYVYKTQKGLSEEIVREISKIKGEPEWMLEKRLTGYKVFKNKPVPTWGADLSGIDFDDVYYYLKPTDKKQDAWDKVPEDIKKTFDKLGIPEAERKFFAGAEIQYDSEVVYGHVRQELEKQGVVFTDTDSAIKKYPELVKKYFGTVIPPTDNKFAALNTAVFSGGSFIYVPKGVKVAMPLQAYFRINAEKAGQFERTLIIADEGADVTYIEGCFVKGTPIKTKDGTKLIEDMSVGDSVLTHLNRYKKVYHTQVRPYTGRLYTIEYGDGNKLVVTAEHPVLASKNAKIISQKWIKVADLSEAFSLVAPIESSALKPIGSKQSTVSYALLEIRNISYEEVRDIPVYNFGFEEDESYVAGGIAVHNCTAPIYMSSSLHSAVVEIIVHKDAHVRYVTIQNWSRNVYNLVTQRAYAYENAHMEWIDANIGSKVNMKYPSVYHKGRGASGEILSVAVAGENQVQDSGGKMLHLAPDTTSKIISKSVSKKNGVASYRGQLYIARNAANVKSTVRCDALLLNKESKTNTYPYMDIQREDATITHEAAVGKIGEEQLFYLMSRGLTEEEALTTVVLGFLDPLTKALPMEYSIELKRLVKLDTSGSVA